MSLSAKISRRSIVAALATTALWPVEAAIRLHRGSKVIPPSTPTVLSVSPNNGDVAGGTSVTVRGTNFTGATAVKFGGQAATSFVLVNSTTITCVTSAHAEGIVNVAVTTPAGTETDNHLYTYTSSSNSITIAFVHSPEYTSANPTISIKMPNTYGVGTTIQRQIQVSGGNWGSPVRDVTHTLDATENEYENVSVPMIALSPRSYDWRVIVNGTQISNVITATV